MSWNQHWPSRFILGFLSLIFIYTTLINIWERPEGLKISCIFIFTIIFMSLVSRAVRSTELRITGVELDDQAKTLIGDARNHIVRIIAWNPRNSSSKNCDEVGLEFRRLHGIGSDDFIIFFEVERGDTSEFTDLLRVEGRWEGSCRVLHARSAVVANSIAALLIYIAHLTGCIPHVYFHWTDVNPVTNVMRFIFLGEGDTGPLTHEVLRRAVKDPSLRPVVHVS